MYVYRLCSAIMFSSFTAPRGPLSPLGNAEGACKLLGYSANIGYCYNYVWADWKILLKYFRTHNGVFANFFNKIFQFDTQNYIAKLSSLNI